MMVGVRTLANIDASQSRALLTWVCNVYTRPKKKGRDTNEVLDTGGERQRLPQSQNDQSPARNT